jgi:hypothetical protein
MYPQPLSLSVTQKPLPPTPSETPQSIASAPLTNPALGLEPPRRGSPASATDVTERATGTRAQKRASDRTVLWSSVDRPFVEAQARMLAEYNRRREEETGRLDIKSVLGEEIDEVSQDGLS